MNCLGLSLTLKMSLRVKGLSAFGTNIISMLCLYPGRRVPFKGETVNLSPPSLATVAAVWISAL